MAAVDPDGGGGPDLADLERRVMEAVKAAEASGDPPPPLAAEVARRVVEKGLGLPNPDLAAILISNLCFDHNTACLWKLLEQAMASRLLFPIHALALLTSRVIPHRRAQPEAYRLYLELMSRYCVSSLSLEASPSRDMVTKLIDDNLQLSHSNGVHILGFGHAVVLFVWRVIICLIDSTLEDCGLPFISGDGHHRLSTSEAPKMMDTTVNGSSHDKKNKHREQLCKNNTFMALAVVEKMTATNKVLVFLRLMHRNMPDKFIGLLQRLRCIEAHKSASDNFASTSHVVNKLIVNIQKAVNMEYGLNKRTLLGVFIDSGACSPLQCHLTGAGKDACWIPFDMFMENAVDGYHLYAVSAFEILTELTKTLQVLNQASWRDTFQALWISALRLVQRDWEPMEGPVPEHDARLCILLAITPLSIVPIVNDDSESLGDEGNKVYTRRQELIASLQALRQFSGLLSPPPSVISAANNAAAKAANFISNMNAAGSSIISCNDTSTKAVGNMMHLIVEACIARNLIDTSAYFWLAYVIPTVPLKDHMLIQESPWSKFMQGAPLTASLMGALMATPASSVAELDKLYNVALNGSEEEKLAASEILCGASLLCGWNIQEHVVRIVIKLLSLPLLSNASGLGAGSYYIGHVSTLNAILSRICYVDIGHILSLFGMVPEVAAALLPLCEALGSLSPPSDRSTVTDGIPVYAVFSRAFLLFLRLWKSCRPPSEHFIGGCGGAFKKELSLGYLLSFHNNRITRQISPPTNRNINPADPFQEVPRQSVYIDSFPKLRAWYFQDQACASSTLSSLCTKSPVYQATNKILNMFCRKMTKVGATSANVSPTSSNSVGGIPGNASEDTYQRPTLPAWDFLEAVPFVLDAVLTACAHGKFSSRELTTGLSDLVEYFPASVITIISYLSSENTCGIWQPVPMNGTDWPSPAANLHSIDSEVKEALASAGINIPSFYSRGVSPMLPLPMAALISLTLTFKLDRNLLYIRGTVSQAVERCAAGSSWPSMPIVGALWTQKVERWHAFIVLACARAPFRRDKDAVAQLIRSCFSSFLGPSSTGNSNITTNRGVLGLLGQSTTDHHVRLPFAPGFIFLRTCEAFHDARFVTEVIFKLVIEWTCKLGNERAFGGPARLQSSRTSLAVAASTVQQVAMLGASLLCIAGGVLMVRILYEETLPTMLLSSQEQKQDATGPVTSILEGYAIAYTLFYSGAIMWGVKNSPSFRSGNSSWRLKAVGSHMDFVAGVLEGQILLRCNPALQEAYISCFVGLLVKFVPSWVPELKLETLKKLASGLRGRHEYDLALSLLEQGGPAAMEAAVDLVL